MSPAREGARLTAAGFLAEVVERHGARPALRLPADGVEWSYADLAGEVARLARALAGAGVGKGSRVALLLGNRPEWAAAWLAAGSLGALVIPVNTFATPGELDYILGHSDASLLLLQVGLARRRYLDDLAEAHPELMSGAPGAIRCPKLPHLRRAACIGLEATRGAIESWSDFLAHGDAVSDVLVQAMSEQVTPSDDGLIIYTSGSTDRPKGVLHSQRTPVLQSWRFAEYMGLEPEDRVWTSQPFFWTAGICMSLGATLAAGACLILEELFEPAQALATLEAERATTLHAWPHQEKALGEHPDAASRDLGALRKLRFSSPLAKHAGLEKDVWGMDASYGLSETFTICSALPADAPAELRAGSSGVALPGMELRIVDPESGDPLEVGASGEIAVRGVTLMRGYYKVARREVLDADGFFHTQDAGWIDRDGHLHWTGRMSNLIKTGGANVSPLESEAALAAYPGLRAGLAVGVPHPTLGEAVVLCAIPSDGAELDAAAIRSHLRDRLAVYKVPRSVLFFAADELDFTGNQKIQVGPLREKALARLARESVEVAGHRYGGEPS